MRLFPLITTYFAHGKDGKNSITAKKLSVRYNRNLQTAIIDDSNINSNPRNATKWLYLTVSLSGDCGFQEHKALFAFNENIHKSRTI